MKLFPTFQTLPVRKKIILVFLLFGFIPLIVFEGYIVMVLTGRLTDHELKSVQQTIDLTSRNLNQVLKAYDDQSVGLYYQQDIMDYVKAAKNRTLTRNEMYWFNDAVSRFMRGDPNVRSVYIFTNNNQIAYWDSIDRKFMFNLKNDSEFLQAVVRSNGLAYWQSVFSNEPSIANNNWVSIGRMIKNTGSIFEEIGVLVINLDTKFITDILTQTTISPNGAFMIVDSKNQIVWHENSKLIGKSTLDTAYANLPINRQKMMKLEMNNKQGYVLSNQIINSDWTIITFIPESDIAFLAQFMKTTIIIVATLLFIGLLIIAIIINKNLLQPIKKMVIRMNEAEFTDHLRGRKYPNNEIGKLFQSFEKMNSRIVQLLHNLESAHQENRTQEMQVLQAQINPHFLYNTLDSINWMARDIHAKEISQMLINLSSILRYSIKDFSDDITLKDEVKWLRSYIYIQKKRFEDQFDIVYDLDESLLDCKAMKLILQPIVENSLLHGMRDVSTKGQLSISIHRKELDIEIMISDNGCGMSEDLIVQVLNGINGGIGVYNINQRLKYKYGESYGVTIQSQLGIGTNVSILIPHMEGENPVWPIK
jgi:two-component system sensor histidine kinase YesM